jgi:hypothetical protein
LEDTDIIQIDATIIAGVLILLTLTSIFGESDIGWYTALQLSLTLAIILPFTISAYHAISTNLKDKDNDREKERIMKRSIIYMRAGFAYLIGAIVLLLAISFFLAYK